MLYAPEAGKTIRIGTRRPPLSGRSRSARGPGKSRVLRPTSTLQAPV